MIKNFLDHKKAMLFDLDGTLVDSMWMWEAIDIEFLGAISHLISIPTLIIIHDSVFYRIFHMMDKCRISYHFT